MTKRYCAIQYSDGKFSAMEFVKKGSLIKIKSAVSSQINNTSKEEAVEEILNLLKENKISANNTIFIAKSPLIKNEIKSFPKMPKKELAEVVEREAERLFPDEEFFHDFIIIEEKEERRGKKVDVLISVAPQNYISELFSFLRKIGKTPELITTKIQNYIGLKSIVEENEETFGFLNLSPEKSSFIILKGNSKFIIERDIPTSKTDIFSETEADNILVEISRTIQFFKQKNRGYDLTKIYVVGKIENLEETVRDLDEMSPYNFILCTGEKLSNKIEIEKGVNPISFLSSYFDILGSVFLVKEKEKINLLPSFYFEKELFEKRKKSFFITIVLLILILIPSFFVMEKMKAEIKKELIIQESALKKLDIRRRDIEKVKSKREKVYKEMLLLGLEQRKIETIVKFFNFLTLNTPDGISLDSAEVSEKEYAWEIRLEGKVSSDTPFLNSKIFNDFYLKLGAFPFVLKSNFDIIEGGKDSTTHEMISDIKEKLIPEEKIKKEKDKFTIKFKILLEIGFNEK